MYNIDYVAFTAYSARRIGALVGLRRMLHEIPSTGPVFLYNDILQLRVDIIISTTKQS